MMNNNKSARIKKANIAKRRYWQWIPVDTEVAKDWFKSMID